MRAIKEELGDNDDDEDDLAALERRMQSAGMPAHVWKHAQRELRYDPIQTVYWKFWFMDVSDDEIQLENSGVLFPHFIAFLSFFLQLKTSLILVYAC